MKTNRRETKDVHQKVVRRRRIGVERRGGVEGAETQRNVRDREWKRRDEEREGEEMARVTEMTEYVLVTA